MTTKVNLYRVVHRFNQERRMAVPHLYFAQCKVLLFWHNIGTASSEKDAVKVMMLHDQQTKDLSFFGRLWEVWTTKFFAK